MSGLSSLRKTSGRRATWTPVTIPIEPRVGVHLRDIWFADAEHGWVVGENGTILATADGGATWTRQSQGVPLPTPESARGRADAARARHPAGRVRMGHRRGCISWRCASSMRLVAGPSASSRGKGRSVVLHTVDGGANWVEESRVPGEELRALFISADGRAWTVGDRVRDGASQVLMRRSPA